MESVVRRPELARLAGGKSPELLIKALFSEPGRALWPPVAPSQTSYEAPYPPGSLPPRIVFTRAAELPWSVVVAAEGQSIVLTGYGMTLNTPLVVRRVSP